MLVKCLIGSVPHPQRDGCVDPTELSSEERLAEFDALIYGVPTLSPLHRHARRGLRAFIKSLVNRRGVRFCVASPEELAMMVRLGRLRTHQDEDAFDSAMSEVIERLDTEKSTASA